MMVPVTQGDMPIKIRVGGCNIVLFWDRSIYNCLCHTLSPAMYP